MKGTVMKSTKKPLKAAAAVVEVVAVLRMPTGCTLTAAPGNPGGGTATSAVGVCV